jgi:hypothetical protein
MRSSLIIISVFCLFGCGKPFINVVSEKQTLANEVRKKAAVNIIKETNLIPFGSGAQMMDQIKVLELFFVCHESINAEKARELVLQASEELLRQINADERIRTYLNNFPFDSKNITIKIYIQKLDGHSFGGKNLSVISLSNGVIKYKIDDPNSMQLITIHEETYEEALQILNNTHYRSKKLAYFHDNSLDWVTKSKLRQ